MSNENGYDFTVGDEYSDIILVVEDEELHVHKSIVGKLKYGHFVQKIS